MEANSNVAKIANRVLEGVKKNHLLTGIDKRRRHCGAVLMIRNIRERAKKILCFVVSSE